jgi:hypothetical protein
MPRPESVTNEDITRWSESIDNDPAIDPILIQSPLLREVCYAGQWLADKLEEIECPGHLIGRLMYTAGSLSFGRKDTWEVHQEILSGYIEGTLEFEPEPNDIN